jgi:hypothetical protein
MISRPAKLERYAGGTELDGFRLGERIHSGAMGHIFRVTGRDPGFPIIMKVPRVGPGESGEGLINFETESMVLPALSGPHVPRFVAVGAIARTPYLVTEWIDGEASSRCSSAARSSRETARIGAAVADAVHSLHLQDAIHLDLKPENDSEADRRGRAHRLRHRLPCAFSRPACGGQRRRGSRRISPEQVLGTRSDRAATSSRWARCSTSW